MEITEAGDGKYRLLVSGGELSLISEGLYAVEDAGRRCLADDVPDEVDRPVLKDELRQLGHMRLAIEGALGMPPSLSIIEGGHK